MLLSSYSLSGFFIILHMVFCVVKVIMTFDSRISDESLHKTPKHQTLMQKQRRRDDMQFSNHA